MLSLLHSLTLISMHDRRKNLALTRWTFVGKVMSLLLNMLSRLLIIFLPRSKHLLISWLHSPSAMILEPPKIKFVTASTFSPKEGKQDRKELDVVYGVNKLMSGPFRTEGTSK